MNFPAFEESAPELGKACEAHSISKDAGDISLVKSESKDISELASEMKEAEFLYKKYEKVCKELKNEILKRVKHEPGKYGDVIVSKIERKGSTDYKAIVGEYSDILRDAGVVEEDFKRPSIFVYSVK